ncbi:7394_t:CDS:1, partial [Racocetra fulgida]
MYDDAISEHKEERSMKNIKIIGVQNQNLKSINDYLDALKIITSIESFHPYLQENIIPVIANWPGQYFIRKILTHYYKKVDIEYFNSLIVPDNISNFIPIIESLHISLNFEN